MEKFLMPKKFLVTGGCGFIGSHIVAHLIQAGHLVTVIDDLSSGYRSNLADVGSVDALIEGRVEDVDLFGLAGFDGVFHLAAQASVPLSVKNFYTSSTTNLLSTLKVIDFCATKHIPLVYASSSAVYGNLPIGDEYGSVELLSPYSADKLMTEIYCDVANKMYGLRSYGLRFFNVYGPRQDPTNPYSGVISIFADRILKGKPITINGGHQTRDFIYVNDVVRGLWNSYEYLLENSVSTYSNLLTGNSISIDELANILMSLAGKIVEKRYQKLPPGDPEKSLGTIDRMRDQLKMSQFVKLDDGLRQVLIWMKATL
jgi:UDP-glucose 4-epimerase